MKNIMHSEKRNVWRNWLRNLVVILLTVAFIYLIVQNISLVKVKIGFTAIGFPTIMICLALHLLVFVFRTLPMAFLMREVPFIQLLNSHLIHNFYLQIMPANIGELSLPLLLADYTPKSKSLSSLFVARAYTTLVVLLMFLVSLTSIPGGSTKITMNAWKSAYIGGSAVIIGLTLLFFVAPKLKSSNNRFVVNLWKKLTNILANTKEQLIRSIKPLRLLSILVSNLMYLFLMACFYQVLLHRMGVEVNLMQQFFIMSIQVAMMLLPIKSIGNFGLMEGSWMLGLLVLGFGRSEALETGLIVHLIALLSATFYFLIGLLLRNTWLKTPSKMNENVVSG